MTTPRRSLIIVGYSPSLPPNTLMQRTALRAAMAIVSVGHQEEACMSEEENKAIVRRFFEEVWNQQKDDVIDEIFASNVVFNGHPITRDALKTARVLGLTIRQPVFACADELIE